MVSIGLNHMTVPQASARELFAMAEVLGCVGVELRNDLGRPLFDGEAASDIAAVSTMIGQRVLGLAEVKAFNVDTATRIDEIAALLATGAACGAEGIALIPAVGPTTMDRDAQKHALHRALIVLQPLFETYALKGFIEPLGFASSSLRFKQDVVDVLETLGSPHCFALIHDTFHHHLAGEKAVFAAQTAIVHVSGVTDAAPTAAEMTDAHRGLVGSNDRLDNIGQLRSLRAAGYTGPVSFEAFAPDIHDMKDPTAALAGSIAFINAQLAEVTAGAV